MFQLTFDRRLLAELHGLQGLVASLLYGTGMRLMECLRLRVQDIEFERNLIVVRHGKGGKDRIVPLPGSLVKPLGNHLAQVGTLHERDLADGFGEVLLPNALAVKYQRPSRPGAGVPGGAAHPATRKPRLRGAPRGSYWSASPSHDAPS